MLVGNGEICLTVAAGDSHLLLPSSVVVDGRPLKFMNDLDIDGDGIIYFTDTSRYIRRDFLLDFLDGRGTGRLVVSVYLSLVLIC